MLEPSCDGSSDAPLLLFRLLNGLALLASSTTFNGGGLRFFQYLSEPIDEFRSSSVLNTTCLPPFNCSPFMTSFKSLLILLGDYSIEFLSTFDSSILSEILL